MNNDDIAPLYDPPPDDPAPMSLRQGIVQSWDADTGENTIQVAGATLVNLPSLTAESAELVAGDVVALLWSQDRALVIGKVTTPGDPGTVPSWSGDIVALQSDMTTVNTVTIPAVQADVVTAQTAADAAQSDASSALNKFPITETDITDGAISTPKLAADAIDGMVITGALLRTAASGQRVEIDSASVNEIKFYSDAVGEISPGLVEAVSVTGSGQVRLASPEFTSGVAEMVLQSHPTNITTIDVTAGQVKLRATETSADVILRSDDGDISLSVATGIVRVGTDQVAINGPYWYGYLATSPAALASGANVDVTTWTADGTPNSSGITVASGVATVPRDGRYRITAQLTYPASNTTGSRIVQVFTGSSGGSVLCAGSTTGNAGNIVTARASKTLRMTTNSSFRVVANQGSGGSLSLVAGAQWCYFQVEWVGP